MADRFKVIDGDGQPKDYDGGDIEIYRCPLNGCNSTLFIDGKAGMMVKGNKIVGGSKQRICVHCLARGDVTIL